jgi:biopolymer transport protein ExbB/TolQ
MRLNSVKNALKSARIVPLAAAATALTYFTVATLSTRSSYIFVVFFERSWIQYASTLCFWMAIASLALMSLSLRRQREAFVAARAVLRNPGLASTLIWTDAERVRAMFITAEHQRYRDSIVFTRIVNALDRLRKAQSTSALGDYFRTRGDADQNELETSYSAVRFLIWVIPTLGFLGTVMGISFGIQQFAQAIQVARDFDEIKKQLPTVTDQLGTAFDTTLLALVLSAVAVLFMSLLLKRQEQLLESIDNLCSDEVGAMFAEHSRDSQEIIQALGESIEALRNNMNGNRAAIAQVITDKLPSLLSAEIGSHVGSVSAAVTRTTSDLVSEMQRMRMAQEGSLAAQEALLRSIDAHLAELRRDDLPTLPRTGGRAKGV